MSWFYRRLIRPVFFKQDPEEVHTMTMRWLGRVSRNALASEVVEAMCGAAPLPVKLFGLRFPNPVGLAAGMDKSAEAVPAWKSLGFGHIELGAVTWHAQPGNDKPRIFRSPPTEAIINRMGFNNPGAAAVAEELAHWRAIGRWPAHPVGINLGKSKITPLSQAPEDYANSFRALWPHADFFVVNVSSPNTPNLRKLQDKGALDEILAALQRVNEDMVRGAGASKFGVPPSGGPPEPAKAGTPNPESAQADVHASRITHHPKPILVKVAPDLTLDALDEILELAMDRNLAGLVATNTTISRPQSDDQLVQKVYAEAGGLSGKPVRERSTEVVRHLYRQSKGKLPIIGVGGIFTVEDAWEKITAGASLIQLYTGFIYEGPTLPKRIVAGLAEKLRERGMKTVSEAVGSETR